MEILKNIESIRNDFPILNTKVNGNQLIYFDNAATSQTPNCVICLLYTSDAADE